MVCILITVIVQLTSFGQIEESANYLDSNKWVLMDKITVRQFINELKIPTDKPDYPQNIVYILHTVGQQDTNWISEDDIEYLMTLIDSKQEAKCIMRDISSYKPLEEKPILGDQVILLIYAYRKKLKFPYGLTMCGEFVGSDRTELREWWENEKKK